jgi:hypothetical protein
VILAFLKSQIRMKLRFLPFGLFERGTPVPGRFRCYGPCMPLPYQTFANAIKSDIRNDISIVSGKRPHLTCDSAPARQLALEKTTATSKRAAWAAKLRQVKMAALRSVTGIGFKVFAALELHSDQDGYCWPLVETIQKLIGIDRRRSIFEGLAELEAEGLIDRAKLISRSRGKNAPTLYRIGGKVETLPPKAAIRYVLAPEPRTSISVRVQGERGVEKRHVANQSREVSKNDSTGVSKNGMGRGVEKRHTELGVKGELGVNEELDSEALTDTHANHHRFSTTTQTDDDGLRVCERDIDTLQSKAKKLLLERGHSQPVVEIAIMRVEDLARAKGSIPRSVAYFLKSIERSLEDSREVEAIATIVRQRLDRGVALTAPLEPHERHDAITVGPEPRDLETFERFYASYPNQVGKPLALHEWMKSVIATDSAQEILEGLERWKRSPEWLGEPRYIPSPTKFILGRQWMDTPMSLVEERREKELWGRSAGALTDTDKVKIEPHVAVELQKQIEVLIREMDETDRARQTPGCKNPDLLIEHRKLLVRELVNLQRKLRGE